MMRKYVLCILWFTLAISFGNTSTDYDGRENEISRLIHNERRLIAFSSIAATIGAIAGTTSVASTVAHWSQFDIDDDGAKFKINNYFEDIELHYKGLYKLEGSTLEPPASLIRAAKTGAAGGVFDDSGPGDSAGYIQYEITNPITIESYCIGYLWSSEADSFDGSLTGSNWIIGTIQVAACPGVVDGFLPVKSAFLTAKQASNNNDELDYTYHHPTDHSVVRVLSTLRARAEQVRIASSDLKVGMTLHVSTPDGDEDHPEIEIDIGPYKKVFGNALSQDYFVFVTDNKCAGGDTKDLGWSSSVTDCHHKCITDQGDKCKYFKYSIFGVCTWFSRRCDTYDGTKDPFIHIFNNVKYASEYGLVENNRHCSGERTTIDGTFKTSDECWIKCKSMPGCEYFTFSAKGDECKMESECGYTERDDQYYNLYGKYTE